MRGAGRLKINKLLTQTILSTDKLSPLSVKFDDQE